MVGGTGDGGGCNARGTVFVSRLGKSRSQQRMQEKDPACAEMAR